MITSCRGCAYTCGAWACLTRVAEELAQESLLRLWLRAADFDPAQGALSTWLYRIARNLHIDRIAASAAGCRCRQPSRTQQPWM